MAFESRDVQIALARAIGKVMGEVPVGRFSWNPDITSIHQNRITGSIHITGVEELDNIDVHVLDDEIEQLNDKFKKAVQDGGGTFLMQCSAVLSEQIDFSAISEDEGKTFVFDTVTPFGNSQTNITVDVSSAVASNKKLEQIIDDSHILVKSKAKAISDYLNTHVKLEGKSFTLETPFINPMDIETIKTLQTQIDAFTDNVAVAMIDKLKRLGSLTFTKKADDSDDGIVYTRVVSQIEDILENANMLKQIQLNHVRIRSFDLRQALGMTVVPILGDIEQLLRKMDGLLMSFEDSFVVSRNDALQETQDELVNGLSLIARQILEKNTIVRSQYQLMLGKINE